MTGVFWVEVAAGPRFWMRMLGWIVSPGWSVGGMSKPTAYRSGRFGLSCTGWLATDTSLVVSVSWTALL